VNGVETAAGAGAVYGVLADGSLWGYDPAQPGDHWALLVPQGVLTVAAPLRR
jgi:hypothetical protein